MAVRVTRLALGGRTEHDGDVIEAFDVGTVGEIEIAAIRLRFACERVLQILFCLAALELHGVLRKNGSPPVWRILDFV